jgi:hypothetical protein
MFAQQKQPSHQQIATMRFVLGLIFTVYAVQAAPRLRRGLNVESLEIKMQLETNAEKTAQIHHALGHDDEAVDRAAELEKVLKTGSYPKPDDHQGKASKTTDELISQYLEAEPSDQPLTGHSYLSKGGTKDLVNNLQQPSTLGVQGSNAKVESYEEKKMKGEADDEEEEEEEEEDMDAKDFVAPTPAPAPVSDSPTSDGAGTKTTLNAPCFRLMTDPLFTCRYNVRCPRRLSDSGLGCGCITSQCSISLQEIVVGSSVPNGSITSHLYHQFVVHGNVCRRFCFATLGRFRFGRHYCLHGTQRRFC